jgi:FG-GAP-like repeat
MRILAIFNKISILLVTVIINRVVRSKILVLNFIIVICAVQSVSAQVSYSTKSDFTSGTASISVAHVDFNRDGKPEMVVTNSSSNTISLFLNTTTPGDAAPNFSAKTNFLIGSGTQLASITDINNDGKEMIVNSLAVKTKYR